MGYAKHIGRVGALAVALGIGTAVATSPGIAWATPDANAPTTSTGDADATDTTDTPDTSEDSSLANPPSSTISGSTTTTGTQTSPALTTVTTTTGPDVTISSSGGANTSTDDNSSTTASATATASPPQPDADPTVPQQDSKSDPESDTSQRQTSSPVSKAPASRSAPTRTAVQDVAPPARLSVAGTDLHENAAPTTALSTARQQTPRPPAADPVASLLAIPGTLISVTTGLMAAAVAPFIAPGPAAPADPPLLWAVMAWVRRQFTQGFANKTPVAKPLQTTQVEPPAAAVAAAGLPAEFERTTVVSGLTGPVDFAFLPGGRILIGEKAGAIKIFHDGHLHTPITLAATTAGERGIGGIEVDPNFASNGFIYVSYTSAGNRDRLSRFTLTGDTINPTSERVLLQATEAANNIHHGGEVSFGPDGKLYWSTGNNGVSSTSQDLSSIYGKVLRLNPEDGKAPADNPFVNNPDALPQVYAYGFRNPFRFTFTPGGKLLLADVGENTWEELNVVTAGANYGWPNAEGPCSGCSSVGPIYSYNHNGAGASIQSVLVYTGNTFGESYRNKVFIADGVQNWIKELTFDPELTSFISERTFDDQTPGNTVKLAQGLDGNIYQLTIVPNGEITRIAPAGGNRAPSAVITATPSNGYGPLNVSFSSGGSSDPEGQTLSYAWDFGDPSRTDDVSTNPNASWTYTTNGSYVATLTVSDGAKIGQATKTVVVGSTPPVAQINQVTTPRGDLTYHAGDTISFTALTGETVDAEDPPLPNSAYRWTINLHHNTHFHPFAEIVGPTGSVTIPRTPDNVDTTFYRMTLSVTDSSGLTSTQSVDVNPRTVALTFNANNPDATFTIDGIPHKGSYTETAVVGVQRVISAPSPQFVSGAQLIFANWSDGGAQTHTVTTPATATTYAVTYNVVPVVSSSAQTGVSPRGVAVSSTKVYVANQGSNTVSVIDRANPSAAPVTINVVSSPAAIALGPANSNRAYVAGNNAMSVINTATNTVIATVTNLTGGQAYGIAVSDNGQRVYVATSANNRVVVIDTTTTTPTVLTRVPVGSFPAGLALSADGTRLYVTNYNSRSVSVINTADNTGVGSITVGTNPFGIAVGSDGRVYVSNVGSGSVSVINTTTNNSVSTIAVGTQPAAVAISPDGSRAYVANGNDTMSIIDTATNTVISTVTIDTAPETQRHSVAVSPDGRHVYISDMADRTVRIIATA